MTIYKNGIENDSCFIIYSISWVTPSLKLGFVWSVLSSIYRILGNFYVGLFLRFGTKEDFTNLNICEKASDQRKPHPYNTQY